MDLVYKILASLGGISFVVSGILAWLGKVYIEKYKARLNREFAEFQSQLSATNEKIRAKLDNSVYVTKAYFDKELSAYNLIWNSMFETRESVLHLRPSLDHFDPAEPFDERKLRRLRKFKDTFNLFVTSVESNNPDEPNFEYWKEAELSRSAISKLFDDTCEAIRTRMHTLTVVA